MLFSVGRVSSCLIEYLQKYKKILYQIPIFRTDESDEVVGGDVHLITDFSGTEIDFVAKGGTFFHESGEGLLHADRGTTSVDVTCERQEVFLLDHGDVLDTGCGGGFLEVQTSAPFVLS